MLSMRQVVRSLIALCSAVDGVQSELLSKIHAILMDERLEIIDQVGRLLTSIALLRVRWRTPSAAADRRPARGRYRPAWP
jgi:hypothetical protein